MVLIIINLRRHIAILKQTLFGMKTYYQIKTELLHLRLKIESTNINELPKQKNWGGADVIITSFVTEDHKKWLGFQP